MLKANKNRFFEQLFTLYNRNLLKRRFHSFNISGLDFLKNQKHQIPQVIYANHSSWWDGLVIFEICQQRGLDFYVMMEEKQLANLPLFRRFGAFSVIRENPREAVKSINYAVEILREKPLKTLLIFPQGTIQPNDLRPVVFFNGLSRIAEKVGECRMIPTAVRYEFLGKYKPEIFVKIGEPQIVSDEFDAKNATSTFSQSLTATLDELKDDLNRENFSDYFNIFK